MFALGVLAAASLARAAVPAVVASSTVKYATGGMQDPTKVVIDGNGNLFTADSGKNALFGVPAGSTTPISLLTGLGGTFGVAVDSANDVIVSASYNGHVYFLTAAAIASGLSGGSVGTPLDLTSAYGFGTLEAYYASWSDVTVDQNNVVYMSTNYCGSSCSTTGNAILSVQTQGTTTSAKTIGVAGVSAVVVTNLPHSPSSLVADTSGNLYFADGVSVFVVNLTAKTKVPVVFATGFTKPTGVSLDRSGNMYVSDNSTNLIWEIPLVGGVLTPANKFIVASPPVAYVGLGFDRVGNFYTSDGYAANSIDKATLGYMSLGSSPVATASGNVTMTFAFNSTVTLGATSIALYQGTGAATEFRNTFGGNCGAKTYTAGQVCTVQVGFTPASTGVRRGAVALLSATNIPIVTGYLTGVGTGAGLTFDPGTQASITANAPWKTPSAIALDGRSNLYVADSTANVVQVVSSTGTPTATIGSGLKAPKGVAVDGAGNVIIADTGNNQIVEVPNENGTLNTADQIVVLSSTTQILGASLVTPLGVTADQFGNIYVADSGNHRVLLLNTVAGIGNVNVSTVGTGFTTPVAVALDNNGLVYVADSGANQISLFNGTTGAQTVALNNLSAPTSVSIDASGAAYIVNSGNATVLRVPSVSGALNPNTQLTLGSLALLTSPTGVAVNGSGNVAIADSGAPGVFTLVRTAGSLLFGPVDTSLSSIAQTLTLTSAGTSTVTLGSPTYVASGATTSFAVTSGTSSGCANGQTLTVGATCGYSAVFSPTATGPLSETLLFSANAVNAPALGATLSGTGTNLPQTTTTLVLNPAAPFYGQAVNVTATVTPSKAGNTPTGSITFYVDGIAQRPIALSMTAPYSATYTFPPLSLTASTHAMEASYSGDANNASSDVLIPFIITITREPSVTTSTVYPTVAQPVGSPFTFTGIVSPVAQGTPTGTMYLVAAGTTSPILATGTVTSIQPVAGGPFYKGVTLTYTPPALGLYQYQILYSGDVNFLPSTSNIDNVSVQPVGFTVTLPASSFTVTAGQSVVIPVTITGISGYGGNITVGALNTITNIATPPCSGLPSYVTCTFSPGIVSLAGGNYPISNPRAIINLTLGTNVPPAIPYPTPGSILWPGAFVGMLGLALAAAKRRGLMRTRLMSIALCMLLAGFALGSSGCGSGSAAYPTPKGTTPITLTVSGTPLAGSTTQVSAKNPNLVNTATFQLTVQ